MSASAEEFLANVRAVTAFCPTVAELEAYWRERASETATVEGQSFCPVGWPRRRPAPKFTTQDEETPR